jgi:hypothetical protein
MKRGLLFIVLLCIPALETMAHGIRLTVVQQQPLVLVNAGYHGSKPLAGAKVSVRFQDEKTDFLKGETGKDGIFSFKPDKPGKWIVTVDDLMGHRKTRTINIGEDFFPPPPAPVETAGKDKHGEKSPAADKPVLEEEPPQEKAGKKSQPPAGMMWGYLLKILLGVVLILVITVVMHHLHKKQEASK